MFYKFCTVPACTSPYTQGHVSHTLFIDETARRNNDNIQLQYKSRENDFPPTEELPFIAKWCSNITSANTWLTENYQQQLNCKQELIKILYDSTKNVYREVLSVVINSTTGICESIISDNKECLYCPNQEQCIDGECYQQGKAASNVIVFVSWTGSDVNGEPFISQMGRLNRLQQYAMQDVYMQTATMTS